MSPAPLSEAEALALFLACAVDARDGAFSVTPEDERAAGSIVRLLGLNRAAIHLAAARLREASIAQVAETLRALSEADGPVLAVRARLARGENARLHGRLVEAEGELAAVLAESGGDIRARADAHRLLGAVYCAQGRGAEALEHKERALALFASLGDASRTAIARGEVGTVLATLGALRRARTFHEEALGAHRELGHPKNEAIELSYLGVALHRAGHMVEARRAHAAALSVHRDMGNVRSEAADEMHLGYVSRELDEPVAARAHFEAALEGFRRAGDRALEGVVLSYLGVLAVEEGRPEVAGPLLRQALAVHDEVRSERHASTTWMHLGYHHAALDEAEDARHAYERALARADHAELENRAWLLALSDRVVEALSIEIEDTLTRTAVALFSAAARVRANDPGAERDARACLADAASALSCSTRVRRARRALEAELAVLGGELVVGEGARWFEVRGAARVDLSRRKPLRFALAVLVERHGAARGQGVTWGEVLAAAWPGERVDVETGFSRVRNALAQLRKAGLRDILVTRDDGYMISPACVVRTVVESTI